MKETAEAIFRAIGLAQIDSPWLAILVLSGATAVLFYLIAKVSVFSRKHFSGNPTIRHATTLLLVAAFGALALLVTVLALVAHERSGIAENLLFNTFCVLSLVLSNAPFWYVYWRAGILTDARLTTRSQADARKRARAHAGDRDVRSQWKRRRNTSHERARCNTSSRTDSYLQILKMVGPLCGHVSGSEERDKALKRG
jgi:hypothetical protein